LDSFLLELHKRFTYETALIRIFSV